MWNALKAAKEWLLGAIGILGLIFSFLFFGSKPDSAISVVWAYAVVCLLLCLSVWLMGALLFALSQQRQTVARIQAVFSATGNPTIDLSFLLNPNDSFSSLMKCSVFYLEGSVELYIGGAFVDTVQEDKKVQLKISSRESSKTHVWSKIEVNDKTFLDKVLVKVGERKS
jgi:hypothetical protein